MEFCIFEKVNNSIATKLRVAFIKTVNILECFRTLHNSMTTLCSAFF